jgi:hypothetical protein
MLYPGSMSLFSLSSPAPLRGPHLSCASGASRGLASLVALWPTPAYSLTPVMLVSSGRPVFVLARDRRLASRLAFYRDHVTLTPSSTCPTQSVGVVTLGRVVHMAHFCSIRVVPPVFPLLPTLGACFIALCAAFALVIAPITSLCDGLRDLVSCTFRSPTSLCALPISPFTSSAVLVRLRAPRSSCYSAKTQVPCSPLTTAASSTPASTSDAYLFLNVAPHARFSSGGG